MLRIPGKIPIAIHPLFWLIALFIGWMWTMSLVGSITCLLIILGSVLFHEFGHALTAMAFGQKARIELAAFGGFTYREGAKLSLPKEFLVVLNGPITGLILFVGAYLLQHFVVIENEALNFAVRFTMIANLFWTIINLVPVLPLDGGHLLSIILEAIFGFKGIKMAIVVGLVISVVISIVFFAMGMFLVGALFLILTFESFRSLRYYKIFTEKDRDVDLQKLMKEADFDHAEGRVDQALEKIEKVRSQTKEGILYTLATQELALIYKEREKYEAAYSLLKPIKKHLTGEHLALFHFLAYMIQDYSAVVEVSSKCFQETPSYNTALINSLAYAALDRPEASIGWLECSIREGLPSINDAVDRLEFDTIRETKDFTKFEDKYAAE